MEKHISVKILLLLLAFSTLPCFAQKQTTSRRIQLNLWAEVDAYPGLKEVTKEDTEPKQENSAETEKAYAYPVERLKQLSAYLLNGMVYGWEFVYTPSDKLRNVAEYFECNNIKDFEKEKKQIIYDDPLITDSKITCWIRFERDPQMIKIYNQWANIKNPHIRGSGKDSLENGFDGIVKASENALKDAIREYYRKIIKNKPKEIRGTVLIKDVPAIYIKNGQYVVELDFFVETVTISEYSQF